MKVVVMAGGSGTRLWPLSRAMYPKQFLSLAADKTMLQATLDRCTGLTSSTPVVICNEDHRFIVAEQLRTDKITANIILEPMGKNTAPAIALAALYAMKAEQDPVLLVLAADHVIQQKNVFQQQVKKAALLAEKGYLVTFGIVADKPETGYGYIQRGENIEGHEGYRVKGFVEKPNQAKATEYLQSGEYYWNSGMFMFRASSYINELKKYRPDILAACELAMGNTQKDMDFVRVDKAEFQQCASESIDYAVMEKTSNSVVVPLDAGWSDVGSWSSLWEVSQKDENHNTTKGDVLLHDTHNSFVLSTSRLVATVGLNNIVVVETKDAVLVADKDKVQEVKKIVDQLKSAERPEYQLHREVYRPWGNYDSIDNGTRYQVKRITVKPGAKLSVQMHHHRAEHWIVVSGTAKVLNGNEEKLLTENESIYIPVGAVHYLENPGKIPLELIEVQSGSYLGEDDIVRFEDMYGRS